jgi:DedD protein
MDFLFKQRLVGAVVLVALAVIFIPMLLEGPDRNLVPEMAPLPEPRDEGPGQPLERFPQAGEIPGEPELSVVQGDAEPLPDAEGDKAPEEAEEKLPLELPEEEDAPVSAAARPAETPQVQVEPASSAGAATAPGGGDTPSPGPLGNWVVQVGSFSSEQNALRLRDRLRKENFATQVEKVVVGGKTHFRVRVGPYLERAEADQDQKKLASTFDLKGRVLSYP